MPNNTLEKWDEKTLGELCDVLDSRRKPITKKDRVAGVYPYYGATGILDYVSGWIFDEELVLLGEDGAKWTSGEQSAFKINGKTWVNNHAHVLRPKRDRISDTYLIYNLNFQNLMPYITGTTVPKLNQEKMRSITIPLPPLPEQERIVAKLDKAFEAIDKVKANAEQNLNNAKELLNTRLNILINNLSKKYDILQLKDITTKLGDGLHGTPKFDVSGSVYFINGNNLDNGKIIIKQDTKTTTKEEYAKYKKELNERTILVSINGTVGNVAFYNNEKIILGKSACYFNLKENISKEYIKQLIQSNYFLAYASRNASEMTIKNVSLDAMRKFPVPMPPLNEQELISENINQLQEQTKQLEQIYTQKIKECDELKQSILQKAFRGEL